VVLTVIFRAAKVPPGADETRPHRYTADPGEAAVPAPAGASGIVFMIKLIEILIR
jgi:hypothetical protein